MPELPATLQSWLAIAKSQDPAGLDTLLADDVAFRSPAVFAPQEGKAGTTQYLAAALAVLGPTLRYVGQWHDDTSAVLEFEAELDDRLVHGVDLLRWNGDGQIVSFTVMVRPLRGLERVIAHMQRQLAGQA